MAYHFKTERDAYGNLVNFNTVVIVCLLSQSDRFIAQFTSAFTVWFMPSSDRACGWLVLVPAVVKLIERSFMC